MPTFCRHNRLAEKCPICSKREVVSVPRSAPRRPARSTEGPARAPRRSTASGMTVRRLARAADDGYENDLVPGLRSSVDAERLADELAFSAARLDELATDPPGLLGEAAQLEDREEAAWLCFLVAYVGVLEGEDPWAGVRAARVPWSTGELPRFDGVPLGPRTSYEPRRGEAVPAAYRAWAARGGGQIAALHGGDTWPPERRFDRGFERLAISGFSRAARIEFLTLVDRLGFVDLDVWSLMLGSATATDPVLLAAKRLLGIGDAVLLQRRSSELATATGVPVAALDLAYFNWSAAPEARVSGGSAAVPSPETRARVGAALGV